MLTPAFLCREIRLNVQAEAARQAPGRQPNQARAPERDADLLSSASLHLAIATSCSAAVSSVDLPDERF